MQSALALDAIDEIPVHSRVRDPYIFNFSCRRRKFNLLDEQKYISIILGSKGGALIMPTDQR